MLRMNGLTAKANTSPNMVSSGALRPSRDPLAGMSFWPDTDSGPQGVEVNGNTSVSDWRPLR